MKLKRIQVVFVVFSILIAGSVSTVTAEETIPIIKLEQAVHFLTPSGDDVVVEAGTYEVEAGVERLRLMPKGADTHKAILIKARALTHKEEIMHPEAGILSAETQDSFQLALFLPRGKGLEAIGSFSGVRSRYPGYPSTPGTKDLGQAIDPAAPNDPNDPNAPNAPNALKVPKCFPGFTLRLANGRYYCIDTRSNPVGVRPRR